VQTCVSSQIYVQNPAPLLQQEGRDADLAAFDAAYSKRSAALCADSVLAGRVCGEAAACGLWIHWQLQYVAIPFVDVFESAGYVSAAQGHSGS
jgi:hypothetical protein